MLVIATLPPDGPRLLRQGGFETRPYMNLDPTTLDPVCHIAYGRKRPDPAVAASRRGRELSGAERSPSLIAIVGIRRPAATVRRPRKQTAEAGHLRLRQKELRLRGWT